MSENNEALEKTLNREYDLPRAPRRRRAVIAGAGATAVVLSVALILAGRDTAAADPKPKAAATEQGKEGEKEKKAPVPVSVTPVAVGSIGTYLAASANLVADQEVKILAEAEGRVATLRVEEGQRVATGEVLATLARGDAEMARNKARLRASNAADAWERGREMFAQELVSREALDKLKLEHEVAAQELAEAEWRLDRTTIRAPFGGLVTNRTTTLGQHVRPGDELFVVTDLDPLVARIYLPERDVLALDAKSPVRLALKADESIAMRGRIRQVSPVVDIATGTVKVTVEAVEAPSQVRPGAFVTVAIERERHERALLVPRNAVLRDLDQAHVFVHEKGIARRRTVTTGMEEGDRVEVLSGLREGEQVIVAGQGTLKDGADVAVLGAKPGDDKVVAAADRAAR